MRIAAFRAAPRHARRAVSNHPCLSLGGRLKIRSKIARTPPGTLLDYIILDIIIMFCVLYPLVTGLSQSPREHSHHHTRPL